MSYRDAIEDISFSTERDLFNRDEDEEFNQCLACFSDLREPLCWDGSYFFASTVA